MCRQLLIVELANAQLQSASSQSKNKLGAAERSGGLPVHGVQRVRLVVVPALMVADVDGDRRVEGGEEVLRRCKDKREKQSRELRDLKQEISKQKAYNKAT